MVVYTYIAHMQEERHISKMENLNYDNHDIANCGKNDNSTCKTDCPR